MTAYARDSDHVLKFTVVLPECTRGCRGKGVCPAKTLKHSKLREWYGHKSIRRESHDCGCLVVEGLRVMETPEESRR